MTLTIYTFHRADDHRILKVAEPATLQKQAAIVAEALSRTTDQTRRVYVHNGKAIVAAGICRAGRWNDTLRENYTPFEPQARAARTAAGYPNDEATQ